MDRPLDPGLSPYRSFSREEWAKLRRDTPMTLRPDEIARLEGLGVRLSMKEVEEIYLPLSRLLSLYVAATQKLYRAMSHFLDHREGDAHGEEKMPYIIGVAGSVAVGKSTIARLLRELLSRWSDTPRVELVTTDGFLYPNVELERRDLLARKGFPESYDVRRLLQFLRDVKSGVDEVRAPTYSHLTYDVQPPEHDVVVRQPDIVIVEGLNVLQVGGGTTTFVSDFFDTSIYVDAAVADVRQWYVERFLALRTTVFRDPHSYFARYAGLTDEQATDTALGIWRDINEANLVANIEPTRDRAGVVLQKGPDHRVTTVRLRRI